MGIQSYDEGSPYAYLGELVAADGTTGKMMVSNYDLNVRFDALLFANNSAASQTVELYYTEEGSPRHITDVVIPAGAGYAGVAAYEAIAVVMPASYQCLICTGYRRLLWKAKVALTGTDKVNLLAVGGTL